MSDSKTARMNYQAARSELVERIRLRDYVLMLYLVVVGTIMSISFGRQGNSEILFSIPFFALGCAILVSQHNNVIGTLIEFIACDVRSTLVENSEYAEFFVCSNAFLDHSWKSNIDRSFGHGTIIVVPCIISLWMNKNHMDNSPFPFYHIWGISAGLTVFSAAIVLLAFLRRRKVYKEVRYIKNTGKNTKNINAIMKFNYLFPKKELENRYYLVRHGTSKSNEQKLIISNLRDGTNDFGLTDLGRKEIKDSAISIKRKINEKSNQVIYSSPFLRTIESSEILSEVLNIEKIHSEERLRERSFGNLDHCHSENYTKVWDQDLLNPFHTEWNVESVIDVLKRATSLVIEIEKKHSGSTIFLVTHCDVAMILTAGAMKMNPKDHRQLESIRLGEIRELIINNTETEQKHLRNAGLPASIGIIDK